MTAHNPYPSIAASSGYGVVLPAVQNRCLALSLASRGSLPCELIVVASRPPRAQARAMNRTRRTLFESKSP